MRKKTRIMYQRFLLLVSHFVTDWFRGWPMYQDYNAQPSDDGLSNQDCVEIRQNFGQPGQSDVLASGLYWNDRDCSVINPFVCQQPRQIDGKHKCLINFRAILERVYF